MATFPPATKVPGSAGLTTDLNSVYSLLQNILGPVVPPSADVTGAQDVTNVNAAIAAYGRAILVGGLGAYYGNAAVPVGLSQFVYGDPSVTWNNTGSGYAFSASNPGSYSTVRSAGVYGGFTINCTGGGGGIEFGDIASLRIDVQVENAAGIAAHALNGNWWSEWNEVVLRIVNCARGLVFERSGAGTNSYDRSRYRVYFSQQPNQTGIEMGGAAGDVALLEGALKLSGNFNAGATNTGTVVKFNTASSLIGDCELQWGLECDGSAGQVGPQTINFGGTNQIRRCHGGIRFDASGTGAIPFAASNNTNNFGAFTGTVSGDTSLDTKILNGPAATGYNVITTGFPAGWSGTVVLDYTARPGQVLITVNLSITNGTVVTNGETILAAASIGSPWAPTTTKFVSCNQTGLTAPVTVALSSGGGLNFNGAGFTASGTVVVAGQVIYANSY